MVLLVQFFVVLLQLGVLFRQIAIWLIQIDNVSFFELHLLASFVLLPLRGQFFSSFKTLSQLFVHFIELQLQGFVFSAQLIEVVLEIDVL